MKCRQLAIAEHVTLIPQTPYPNTDYDNQVKIPFNCR